LFVSLGPDPDLDRIEIKKLDTDPHRNQCGSTTLVLSGFKNSLKDAWMVCQNCGKTKEKREKCGA
jgi:transcription elongation factor Elf1